MRAFISYSHKDANLLTQLHEHLAALRRQGLLDTWTDREICAGDVIDDHVSAEIEDAELYLLLVSSSFINSNYCFDKEFARALVRQKAGKARIVPIIVRECDWQIPELRQFKALPEDGKAVVSRHWHSMDEGFRNVADGLRSLLEKQPGSEPAQPRAANQAEDNQAKAQAILKLYEEKKTWIADCTRSVFAINALDFLFRRPVFGTSDFTSQKKIPTPSAHRILKLLKDKGMFRVLQESSGRRPGVLAFRELLNIVEGYEAF